MQQTIKTYGQIGPPKSSASFGISRMEEAYVRRKGKVDTPHRHDFYTVLLILDAEGKHIIDFNEYTFSPGQVYFVSPGQVHQVIEDRQSTGFSIVFSSQFLVQNDISLSFIEDLNLFNDYEKSPPLTVKDAEMAKLAAFCEDMLHIDNAQIKFKAQALGSLLKLFFIQCNNLCTLPPVHTDEKDASNTLLKKFRELVNQHFKTWHGIAQYADALHVSPDHLNRVVKSLTGKTAKAYLQSRITIAAKRMLYFSDLSAKEIGYELGFMEPANFSSFFKKCTGSSPSHFRENR